MRLKVSSAKWRPFCLGLNVYFVVITVVHDYHFCLPEMTTSNGNNLLDFYSFDGATKLLWQRCSWIWIYRKSNVFLQHWEASVKLSLLLPIKYSFNNNNGNARSALIKYPTRRFITKSPDSVSIIRQFAIYGITTFNSPQNTRVMYESIVSCELCTFFEGLIAPGGPEEKCIYLFGRFAVGCVGNTHCVENTNIKLDEVYNTFACNWLSALLWIHTSIM